MTQVVSQLETDSPETTFGSATLPDFERVRGEWWLGVDAAASGLNRINGEVADELGAPNYFPGYVTVGYEGGGEPAGYGFLTDVALTPGDPVTILALIRPINGATILAPKKPADQFEYLNYNFVALDAPTRASMGNGHSVGATNQAIIAGGPDDDKFTLYMGVALLGTLGRIYRIDAGGVAQDVSDEPGYLPALRSTEPFQLGGFHNVNVLGHADTAAVAIIADNKGQAFLEEIYPMWKAYAEGRGLAVN